MESVMCDVIKIRLKRMKGEVGKKPPKTLLMFLIKGNIIY